MQNATGLTDVTVLKWKWVLCAGAGMGRKNGQKRGNGHHLYHACQGSRSSCCEAGLCLGGGLAPPPAFCREAVNREVGLHNPSFVLQKCQQYLQQQQRSMAIPAQRRAKPNAIFILLHVGVMAPNQSGIWGNYQGWQLKWWNWACSCISLVGTGSLSVWKQWRRYSDMFIAQNGLHLPKLYITPWKYAPIL